jgi:type II secretory pathway pseudopilin PulG
MMPVIMQSSGRRGRGFALVAALMVMLVVAILVTAVLTMAMSARLLAGSRQDYTQALYLAEAGVNALMADWRSRGPENPPAQPYVGTLANGTATGSYSVTWTSPNPAGVVTLTSHGTANADLEGTIYNLTRTVQVDLDTDGDWAWNHVYYSDTDQPGMEEEPYADVKGGSGEVEIGGEVGDPMDFLDHPNGPAGGETLPSPIWDLWHEWVRLDLTCDFLTEAQLPRDPDGDGIPDPRWPDQATLPAFTGTAVDANPDRHMYWYGASTTTPLDATVHSADPHVVNDENFFMPDWYGEDNPDAYVCNSSNKRFTVTFSDGNYYGNYYVHGDIHVKNRAHIYGTIIATGNITFYGVEDCSITPEIADPDAPCDERVYYPAIIAGGDVVVRDQGVGEDDLRERLRVSGVVWAGNSYVGQASNVEGCIVAPNVRLGGNYLARYAVPDADGCVYEPGASPPPWFREPDRGEMRPVIRTWREVGL